MHLNWKGAVFGRKDTLFQKNQNQNARSEYSSTATQCVAVDVCHLCHVCHTT
jgi:ribosomal protein L31